MGWSTLPLIWAQAPAPGTNVFAPLALRRWCASLTLSSPAAAPSLWGLWLALAAIGAVFLVALLAQGPVRFVTQLFDIPGHLQLAGQAVARLRRSARVVAVTIGMTVVAWTGSQTLNYSNESGRVDLQLLARSRSLGELAIEHGVAAAVTPLRDVLALSGDLLLLIVTGLLVFRVCAERWGNLSPYSAAARAPRPGWGNLIWMGLALYALYRLISLGGGAGDLPLGNCLIVEVAVIPFLMALADGFLLAWLLVELRGATAGETGTGPLDPTPAIELAPAATLACLLGLPARYVATGVVLASWHLPGTVGATALGRYIRWQLSWGLADLQAASWLLLGLAGALAWTRGGIGASLRVYGRTLRKEGTRMALTLALAGLATGATSALVYLLVLALPPQSWVLAAADAYAHYASLPIGLLALAALVELAERSLPTANLVERVAARHTQAETAPAALSTP
ncbi:MAG: hypothetical protein P4L84_04840 [Isosphaeraceae bacterium]|nr:hypothetical protein [Isosphaeraceae bacterium]